MSASLQALIIVALTLVNPMSLSAQRADDTARTQRRQMLEERLRARTGEVVRRRLNLSDEQMTKLQATNRRLEDERASLLMRERNLRRQLRDQLVAEDKADQPRVAQLLDQILLIERQRIDLLQKEQRELAVFLNPVQRAKFIVLQNEMRRRSQEMRRRQMQRPGGPPFRR